MQLNKEFLTPKLGIWVDGNPILSKIIYTDIFYEVCSLTLFARVFDVVACRGGATLKSQYSVIQ